MAVGTVLLRAALRRPLLAVGAWLLWASPAAAYSVLTHQAVIDSTWERSLLPLLRQRYPADSAAWPEAKSYAYGGAVVQDMGYYPLGAEFFTDLTHYVRAGDFVGHLLREARTVNEYAFALGALAHYAADAVGHPECTNRVMPAVYPDLRRRFGPVVTYANAPIRHTELEFSFDVVQVAAGRYRTQDYHKSVGFRVSEPVLARAFRATYGLELGRVLFNVGASVTAFRFAVNQLIPVAARAAWHHQRREIRRLSPRAQRSDYLYRTNRRRFEREYGTDYERPGCGARVLAFALRLLPKIGPLKAYAFKLPGKEGEQRFRASFRRALGQYTALVRQQAAPPATAPPSLPNHNLDTGHATDAGAYSLADAAYARLLRELHQDEFQHLSEPLREDLLTFFRQGPVPASGRDGQDEDRREQPQDQRKTAEALAALRAL